MPYKDGGYILPSIINPPTISLCIEIPDDIYHIAAFWGALDTLTWSRNWQNDADHTAAQVSRVWTRLIEEANDRFNAGIGCDGTLGERCQDFDAASGRATFYPTIDATDLPLGYVVNPWTRITGDNPVVGLKTGDVITDILHIPPLPTIWDHLDDLPTILALGYPSISIENLVGAGTVRVHLISLILGGRVILIKDNNIFSISFLDTNIDTISLPPETYAEHIVEYTFEGSETHRLDMVFVPNVSADIEFIGYGGGFRKAEICGFGENTMPTDYCCDETNDKLDELNKTMTAFYNLVKGGATINFNVQSESSDFKADCSPDEFNKDTGETDTDVLIDRNTALCFTVANFIIAMLYKYGKQFNMTNATKTAILALMPVDVPPDFWSEVQLNSDSDANLSRIDRIASTDTTAFEDILCMMVTNLKGKSNTLANFKLAVTLNAEETYTVDEVFWLTKIMYYATQTRVNYNIFARELNSSYELIKDGFEYECPCEETPTGDCATALDLYFVDGRGLTKTNVGGNLWHFTGDPTSGSGPYFGGVWIKDTLGRCFAVEIPVGDEAGLPVGWTGPQFTVFHHIIGCCGTSSHDGAGGWENAKVTEAYWDCGNSTPVDTYYLIRCIDSETCE